MESMCFSDHKLLTMSNAYDFVVTSQKLHSYIESSSASRFSVSPIESRNNTSTQTQWLFHLTSGGDAAFAMSVSNPRFLLDFELLD